MHHVVRSGVLYDNGLYVKLSKTELVHDRVKLLGHFVGWDGISPDPQKILAVHKANPPKDKSELRSFLGSVSYLRRFVPNFSKVASSLNDLMKKNAAFNWSEECDEAFEMLKSMLVEHVLLCAPRGDGDFVIVADACDVGVGAALMQVQDEELVVLEFASKSLGQTQRKWPTREKEAYAIRWAVGKFEDYVKTIQWSGQILVLTDHKSLERMHNSTTGKIQRWSLYLQQFDIEVKHVSGELNVLADWLSRSVGDGDDMDDKMMDIPAFPAEESVSEAARGALIPYVPNVEDLKKGYELMAEGDKKLTFVASDGLRYSTRTQRLYVPPMCREMFIFWFHGSRFGGHCGVNKTLRRLQQWTWWPGMAQEVHRFVKSCLVCMRRAAPPRASSVMGLLTRPLPLQLISLDFVGPRSWWNTTWCYMVIIDHATRFIMAEAVATPPTTKWAIQVMTNRWFPVFQAPTAVLMDRGPQFRAMEIRKFITEEFMSILVYSSPYYPQGNAINEASHKAIESSLAAAGDLWSCGFEDTLQDAVAVHNSTPHVGTGYSPNYSMFGFELTLPEVPQRCWRTLRFASSA